MEFDVALRLILLILVQPIPRSLSTPICLQEDIPVLMRPTSRWTRWLNSDQMISDSPDEEDDETITHIIEVYGVESCPSPIAIHCRQTSTGISWKSTGLHFAVPCTVNGGLSCMNSDQDTGVECGDFEIRLKCPITYTAADPPAPVYHWDFSTRSNPYGDCPAAGDTFHVYPSQGAIVGWVTSGSIDITHIQDSYPGSSSPCVWPFASDGTMTVDFGDVTGSCLSNPSCCLQGFTLSVWLMISSTGTDQGLILTTGAHDFEASYGVSISVNGAVTLLSPSIVVQISTDMGLLETQHTITRDEWLLLIISFDDGTLTSRINTDVVTDLDPLARGSTMTYPEVYTRLRIGSTSGPAFAIGDLQVFIPMLSNDQIGNLQAGYDTTFVSDCLTYHTPGDLYTGDPTTYSHHYEWPPVPDGVTYFTFKVRATTDALLSLSSTDSDAPQMYQIVLGGWGNTQSEIRLCKECSGAMVPVSTPSLLTPDEYKEFYVSFTDSHIHVGAIGEEPFMSLEHNPPYNVTHVGIISGYGFSVDWVFCGYGGCNEISSCYVMDFNSDIGISPGDYIPAELSQSTCKTICGFLSFTYSIVAGSACYCRKTSLPTQWVTDISLCSTPCPGDSGEKCGDVKHVLQTTSCSSRTDFELGEVYKSAQVGQTVAIPIAAEGATMAIAVDYGDGTPVQIPSTKEIRPHVYTIPGKYVVSASSDVYKNFKAVEITAVSRVQDVVLDCPDQLYVKDNQFVCKLHIFSGTDLEVDIFLEDNMVMSLPVGSPYLFSIGKITHDATKALEDTTHTVDIIVLPSTEVMEEAYLIALEAFVYGDITQSIELHIMKPSCADFPGTVYCQETNNCQTPTDCPLNANTWHSDSVSRHSCTLPSERFCMFTAKCVPSCPADEDRYSTVLNAIVPPRYELVHRILVKPSTVGYNYFSEYNIVSDTSLLRPLLMEVGYVLAIVEPASGVHIAYEIQQDDEPSELSGTVWSEVRKRHFLRAILSQPLTTSYMDSLEGPGVHVVSAVVNSVSAEGALVQAQIELNNDTISGLTIDILPKTVLAQQEHVTVRAWLETGNQVFFTWDWGDGTNETSQRQASNASQYDELTHIYDDLHDNVTITVTAWNEWDPAVNHSGIVEVVFPVQRHQYFVSHNAGDLTPFVYPETVVTILVWHTFIDGEMVAKNTYASVGSYNSIHAAGPLELDLASSGTNIPISIGFNNPTTYDMFVIVSNGYSQEIYNISLFLIESIEGHTCTPMYRPLSINDELIPGKGGQNNIFPVELSVYFVHTINTGTDVDYVYSVDGGAESRSQEPIMSHQFTQRGVYSVNCYAENTFSSASTVDFNVILHDSIKGITVTDLGLTYSNQPRSIQIDISDIGTNSSLMIDFGDGTNTSVYTCPSCGNPYPEAIWEGNLDFTTTVVSHVYTTNGSFYLRVYGWNLVSDFEVVTLVIVSGYYCGTPSLTIRNESPSWRQPTRFHRPDNVIIEAVTYLGHVCRLDQVDRTWDIQQLNATTGEELDEKILLTDLPEGDPMYVNNADTSEIKIPAFYSISYGLYRLTHKVIVKYTNGEIYDLQTQEHVYLEPGDIDVVILPGETTSITKGRGQSLLLQPGVLTVDPDQDPADVPTFEGIKYFCRRRGESWPLVYQGGIDNEPIADALDPVNPLYGTGCFGTGPGRLDVTGNSYTLETTDMAVGVIYEIMVTILKDTREGKASILLTIEEGEVPEASITCNEGSTCQHDVDIQIINPSSDFRIEVDCKVYCDVQSYEWTLTIKTGTNFNEPNGWREYVTGMTTASMFLDKDIFNLKPQGSEIYFTVKVTNRNGEVGTSQMKATLNPPPEPGYCTINPTIINVFETITIECVGWTDDDGIVQYEFYVESSSSSIIKVLTFGNSPSVTVTPPVGLTTKNFVWNVIVRVTDSIGAITTHHIGQITVNLAEDTFDQLFNLVNDDLERTTLYKELIVEDDSHAINWQVLQDASILNELRYSDSLPVAYTTPTPITVSDGSTDNGVTTSQNVTGSETTTQPLSRAQQEELARVTRAYVRNDLANLLSTSSIDSMADVLLVSGTTSVLTSATDELSHQTLATLGEIASTMVSAYDELASSVDQNEIYRVGANILDGITNLYKGSHDSIINPMLAMDAFESSGDGSFNNLVQFAITEDNVALGEAGTDSTMESKGAQAGQFLKTMDETFEKLKHTIAKNKVPREPSYSIVNTNGLTLTVERSIASELTARRFDEGEGSFDVPSITDLLGSASLGDNDVIDVIPYSMDFNPYNYDSTSERISEDTHLMGLSYYLRDNENQLLSLPVQQTSQLIRIRIPRPATQEPSWNHYTPVPHNDTLMSYHSFNISHNELSVTIEVKPDNPDVRYVVFINHVIPPTVDEYRDVFVMPASLAGTNESSNVFSIFMNNTFIGDRTGKYYIGLLEIDESEDSSPDNIIQVHSGKFTSNYSLRTFTSGCSFWRETEQIWSSDGCTVDTPTNSDFTHCLCDHLTSFASTWIVPPTPLDFDYIFANASFEDNITIYLVTIAIYLFFIILFIWARRADNRDIALLGVAPLPDNAPTDRYYYEIVVVTGHRRNAGTQSRVSFIVSGDQDETQIRMFKDEKRKIFNRASSDRFLMSVGKPLGTLNYIRIWHDNSGIGNQQSWFLKYIAIRDIQTKERFYFIASTWFSVVDGDGQVDRLITVAGKEQMQSFAHVFTSHTASKLNDGHLWFSIFNRPPSTRFTRVQRVLCAMMILWLEMLVNIMWYEVRPPPEAGRKLNIGPFSMSPAQISIGVQANLIVFPASFLVVQLFRKARARHKRKSRIELATQHQQTNADKNSSSVDMSDASIRSPSRVIVNTNDETMSDKQQLIISPQSKGCYVRWWGIYIAWIISVLAILSATVITVFYGIQFGNETTKKWFTSVTVAFCTGVFITQPLQAIAVGLFVAIIIKSPNADEDVDMREDEEEYQLKTDEEWLHSYAESKASRRPPVFGPPDPQLIELQRIQRTNELKMHSILREILVYFVFLFIVLLIAYSGQHTQAYHIKSTYTNLLVYDEIKATGVHRSFINATSVDKYWTWIQDMLLPQLHGDVWYNGEVDNELNSYTGDKVSYMLGYVIIRQLRVKKDQCKPTFQMKNATPHCYVGYSWDNEDRRSYERGWTEPNDTTTTPDEYTYTRANDLDGYPFVGRHAVYRGGGYTVKLSGTQLETRATLVRLQQEAWIDHYTRAVFVQFGSYNAFVNLFSSVTLLMEFLPTGSGYPFPRVDVIKLINYTNDGLVIFRIICEIAFFLFIVFFFFKELNSMRVEKRNYFKKFWNYIEIIIILFSIGSITAYFFRYVETLGLLSEFDSYGGAAFVNLQYATYLNDVFLYMFGGVAFFSILKFLKLLRFNKRMHMLADTIHNIRWDLFSFAVLFLFVFFAFSLAFYVAFSHHLFEFSDIVFTMETLLQALLRGFRFTDLLIVQRILGPLFYFVYLSTLSYIVLNFMVTIVIESFRKVRLDATTKSNEYEIVDFIISRLLSVIGMDKTPDGIRTDDNGDVKGNTDDINNEDSGDDSDDEGDNDDDDNMAQLEDKLDSLNTWLDHMMYQGRRRSPMADQKLTMKWYARRAYKLGPLKPPVRVGSNSIGI